MGRELDSLEIDTAPDAAVARCEHRVPEGGVGQVLVADGPLEDVIVMLARPVRA